jgi:chitinase
VEFYRAYGFDGVDFDWEYPADTSRGGKAADKANYGLLVQAVRAAFDTSPDDLELSVAIPVADWRVAEGYDLPVLMQGVDFFQSHRLWFSRCLGQSQGGWCQHGNAFHL